MILLLTSITILLIVGGVLWFTKSGETGINPHFDPQIVKRYKLIEINEFGLNSGNPVWKIQYQREEGGVWYDLRRRITHYYTPSYYTDFEHALREYNILTGNRSKQILIREDTV
jgi:hypothetical protein